MPVREDYFLKVQEEAKGHKDKLIEKAAQILLSLDVPSLNRIEIRRTILHYQMFNQYPPYSLLDNISEREIYSLAKSLGQRQEKKSLALYVHMPFCRSKCTFCYYFVVVDCRKKTINNYISHLKKEIQVLSKKKYLKFRKISSLYWGGGTPSLLHENQINDFMSYLKDHFEIMPDIEMCCETTPEAVTMKKLECLLKNGFNRLSMGIQTFNNFLLKSYDRLHTGEEAVDAFKMVQRAGFRHINVDIMFGLPGQDLQTWKRSLEIVESLKPTNVTTYPLYPCFGKPGEVLMYKKFKFHLPSQRERLLMHVMAIEKFVNSGYIQINPHQFISSHRYGHRHQEYKARNGEIYAVGVAGHSFVNNVVYFHYRSMPHYYKALEENRLPIDRGRKLELKEQMIRFIVLSLLKTSGINRKDGGVDKVLFQKRYGSSVNEMFKKEIVVLKKLRLISESDRYISLSHRGLLYPQDTILFFYLKQDREKVLSWPAKIFSKDEFSQDYK